MPIANSKQLFSLIKSLSSAEKRNFKLYASRNHSGGLLKFIELFDVLDRSEIYDERRILSHFEEMPKSKLVNLKRHLYTQILNSLRVISFSKKPNVELRGLIDYAYILYDKAFYIEALKILEKAKKHAERYHLYYMHLTILEFEKRIESRHITRNGKEKAYTLIQESSHISSRVSDSTQLSNLRTQLHGMYMENGHCQSIEDKHELETFFKLSLQDINEDQLGPIEKIYLYQSHVWYNHILLDFKNCMKFAKKWIHVQESSPVLIDRDIDLYLRGFHYILSSCFHLRDKDHLKLYLDKLENFRKSNYKRFNKLTKIISFQYVHSARLNSIIINGNFEDGKKVISKTLKRIKTYQSNLDDHRILLFYFKIAWIYFGNNNFPKSIFYLNKIINNELPKLREDLQIYSRLMFLMCHYELNNYDVFRYSIKSFKPYFKKLENIYPLQVITQRTFLKLAGAPQPEHKTIMKDALKELTNLKTNSFYNVSFTYLDLTSWLESKINNTSLSLIVLKKKVYKATKLTE